LASYDRALEIKPNDPWSWYHRGELLRKLGRNTEAVASYDQVLDSDPEDEYAWYNQACCYALLGNQESAIASLQAAIRLNPSEYLTLAQTDSDFDNLRANESFVALLNGMGTDEG
jgi:tetratricopeptide (TPR) repeat protein